MNHGRTINKLGIKTAHRRALLSNMASSLILHKRVNTTLAKGKELRKYIEPLITKSKNDTTHSRRIVFSYLGDKVAVAELFREIAKKVADRPGGYTRIFKTGFRKGDNAETCLVELVDYNENYGEQKAKEEKKAKTTRRGRAGTAKKKTEVFEEVQAEETDVIGEADVEEKSEKVVKPKAKKSEKSDVSDKSDESDKPAKKKKAKPETDTPTEE